ncbi:MAG: SRPBCC family protein [Pseudomonadota bacterium]
MRLTTKQDIEAPAAFVFAVMTDFDTWERAAMRRGAEVTRTDTLRQPGIGMAWRVKFDFRGRARVLALKFTEVDPGNRLAFTGDAPTVGGDAVVELMELSTRRTRVTVTTEIKPKTLAARLFVQSMKLAKAKIQRRFEARVGQIAADIDDRYKRSKA